MIRYHSRDDCLEPCPIHAPSDHHMKTWTLVYRPDRGITERACSHGVGHPDPDDLRVRTNLDPGVHGCDGCCSTEAPVTW